MPDQVNGHHCECLDHLLAKGELFLPRVIREYAAYFNWALPPQDLRLRCRCLARILPVLGGLYHANQHAMWPEFVLACSAYRNLLSRRAVALHPIGLRRS